MPPPTPPHAPQRPRPILHVACRVAGVFSGAVPSCPPPHPTPRPPPPTLPYPQLPASRPAPPTPPPSTPPPPHVACSLPPRTVLEHCFKGRRPRPLCPPTPTCSHRPQPPTPPRRVFSACCVLLGDCFGGSTAAPSTRAAPAHTAPRRVLRRPHTVLQHCFKGCNACPAARHALPSPTPPHARRTHTAPLKKPGQGPRSVRPNLCPVCRTEKAGGWTRLR